MLLSSCSAYSCRAIVQPIVDEDSDRLLGPTLLLVEGCGTCAFLFSKTRELVVILFISFALMVGHDQFVRT